MVRFARAEGSKGSNKRVLEEPTPWEEMAIALIAKKDGVDAVTVEEKSSEMGSDEALVKKAEVVEGKIQEGKSKKGVKRQVEEGSSGKGKGKKVKKLSVDDSTEANDDKASTGGGVEEAHLESLTDKDEKKIKKKKKKKGEKGDSKPAEEKQYVINDEGKRVKVFKDGIERTWFDLPFEEGSRMTRYDNMWVKTEMVQKLDDLKTAYKSENLDEKEFMRRMMKAKRKAHKELRVELIYEQKRLVQENLEESGALIEDKKNKRKKKKKNDGKKKKTDTEQEDNTMEDNTIDNGNKEKEDNTMEDNTIDYGKKDTEKEDFTLPHNKIGGYNPGYNWRRDSQNDLGNDSRNDWGNRSQNNWANNSRNSWGNGSQNNWGNNYENNWRNDSQDNWRKDFDRPKPKRQEHTFEENDIMTKFDGFWVRKVSVARLEEVREKIKWDIMGEDERELTQEEQVRFQRAIKKEKRFEHSQLIKELNGEKVSSRSNNDSWNGGGGGSFQRNDDRRDNSNGFGNRDNSRWSNSNSGNDGGRSEMEVVMFDGFWVKKDAAERLEKLKARLLSTGVSQQEVNEILKKERRKEERDLKNDRRNVCLRCREPGHVVSDCPKNEEADQTKICYKCGSTEHTSRDCTLKGKGLEFTYATCFICGEAGHISRECPDNPRGLYPKGGACRECGSVEHLARDCPDLQAEKESTTLKVERIDNSVLESLEVSETSITPAAKTEKKKIKVIQF